jgi:hypothetical protein
MSPVCSVPQSGMIVSSACLISSVLENKHRSNIVIFAASLTESQIRG